jgi:hypothetical protein
VTSLVALVTAYTVLAVLYGGYTLRLQLRRRVLASMLPREAPPLEADVVEESARG